MNNYKKEKQARPSSHLPSNNIGAMKWPETTGVFKGATRTNLGTAGRSPRGLAASPGGKLLFAANFGLGSGYGDQIMILDHNLVKHAIDHDGDGVNPYNLYNLTGSSPENIDTLALYWPTILRTSNGFDGPRNIAFQEFPILEIVPNVIHLAVGGVAPGENLVSARIHPIYGDTARVGISDGSSLVLGPSLSGLTWHRQQLAPSRETFLATSPIANHVTLSPTNEGIGKLLAEHGASHYPSNVALVTVPPQNFIQVLFAEACAGTEEITYKSLAAVIKNRTRLTRGWFKKSAWWGIYAKKFDFSPRVGNNLNGALQVRADNVSESLVADQLRLAFNHGFNCLDVGSEANYRYLAAVQRRVDPVYLPAVQLPSYDICVEVAGDMMVDLLRTLNNDSGIWRIPQPDPNYLDLEDDPTGGCFSFYSPGNSSWNSNPGDGFLSIQEVLTGNTTDGPVTKFPDAGNFESGLICDDYFKDYCVDNYTKADYIQVVVVPGIPLNTCAGSIKNNAPEFIFFRFRENNQPSVVWGP